MLFVRSYTDVTRAIIDTSEIVFIDTEILDSPISRSIVLAIKDNYKKFIFVHSSLYGREHLLFYVKDALRYIIPFPSSVEQASLIYNKALKDNDQFDLLTAFDDYDIDAEETLLATTFIGKSMAMKKLRGEIIKAAKNDMPVLLLGETGVGKTSAAKLIHQFSSRRENNFITKAASEFHDGLIDSVLFGTNEGAYTDAKTRTGILKSSDGGTFFLDEIGLASIELQNKLLLVVESGSFYSMGSDVKTHSDVRLIFATNEDLKNKISSGAFKKDFYFRMAHNIIKFPSLRDCREDIYLIAESICSKYDKVLSSDAIRKIETYDWPGNMRQLITCMNTACKRKNGIEITAQDIMLEF